MNKVKYTGTNISAALLVVGYFFPWAGALGVNLSGFSILGNGLSPNFLFSFISGTSRFFMVLSILVPVCGILILYQNITGEIKFNRYYKPAHFLPAVFLILGIVLLYFKMKPEPVDENLYGGLSAYRDLSPGITDILSFGVYLCLAAAIYLSAVALGKIKDKEYYKPVIQQNTDKSVDKENE